MDTADDPAIWNFAKANDFVIVSLDSDFADLAALYGPPPKVIWLRCGNQTNNFIEKMLRENAQSLAIFKADSEAACLELY